MAEETIFSKIIRHGTPSDIAHQDELTTTFHNISPRAPMHIPITPNILVPAADDVATEHKQASGRMITIAAKIAEQKGIAADGHRLIMNTNYYEGREVYHIHIHLLGGHTLDPVLAHRGP